LSSEVKEDAGQAPFGKIGVVGAGVIGGGVAHALAAAGLKVTLHDTSSEALNAAMQAIRRNSRAYAMSNRTSPKPGTIIANIETTTDMTRLADAEIVIENAPEVWDVKARIYRVLDAVCPPTTILCVNTSTFMISAVARLVENGARVIGVHFMNPVPLKTMAEVIRGAETSDRTHGRCLELLGTMGMSTVTVADSPGFVSNRVLMLTINEAIRTVEENVASAADVDRLFCGCFGHAMGPLATADLIGLDTIQLSLLSLEDQTKDAKFKPCALLQAFVAAGRLGRKTGRGFYDYAAATTTEERA
jgi:3-hydroxybutyryl-CoA dehydrogenase